MTVSIVMSTFKRPHLIERAIKSVLNQTYEDFELIVVDDRSKDNTKEVVESFGDPRIRYVELKRHFGCDTRPKNEGILQAKGEYITFLDDDNEYRPDHLAILIREMKADGTLDVVYGDR